MTTPSAAEPFVATLIRPDDYLHHLNQVASFSPSQIGFLKRKFASRVGWELVTHPTTDCERVIYRDERPILNMIAGVLLLLLLSFIGVMLVLFWKKLEPTTQVPAEMLLLAGLIGLRWAFASRRHRLTFVMRDGRELEFKSRAGDFKVTAPSVLRVVEYLRRTGRLRDSGRSG